MEIIKRGEPKASQVNWEGQCADCNSVIRAKEDEMDRIEHNQRDGSYGRASCPVCYKWMIFYPKEDG